MLIAVAGWMNQRQLQMIDYIREENRILRDQLGKRRMRLDDDQRLRLAAKRLSGNNHVNFWVGGYSSNRHETGLSEVGVRTSADRKP